MRRMPHDPMRSSRSTPRVLRMAMFRDELPFLDRAEAVALEVNLMALARVVVEVEQDVANRPAFHCGDERRDTFEVIRCDRGDLGGVEVAQLDEFARELLAGKRQRPRPRFALFLVGDERSLVIKQEMEFLAFERVQAASTLSLPCLIACARSLTRAG